MSIQTNVCPSCQAPGATGPDAHDEYRCSYCGTSFRRSPGPASVPIVVNVHTPTPAPAQTTNPAVVALAVGAVVLIGVGVAGVLLVSKPDSDPPDTASVVSVPAATEPTTTKPAAGASQTTVTAKAKAKAPPTASFEFHNRESGYLTSFYALGFVTNTSPYVIDKPKITAVLLDAAGGEVGTGFGFGERDVLAPDERSPVKILVKDPPEHASMRFEVVAREASYIPKFAEGLRVEAGEPRQAQFGDNRWELQGKAFNDGKAGAKFVKIEIQALDAEGQLVGLGTSYADGEVLAPASSARWSTSMAVAEAPDHFAFSVSGRLAN